MNTPRRLPILEWAAGYQGEWLRLDVVAGLTGGRRHSQGDGLCQRRSLPVQIGLYTALVRMVIYAVLGASRPLSVSTTTTIASWLEPN